MNEHPMPSRVSATPAAIDLIERLKRENGETMFRFATVQRYGADGHDDNANVVMHKLAKLAAGRSDSGIRDVVEKAFFGHRFALGCVPPADT